MSSDFEFTENERQVLLGLVMGLVDADEERSLEEIEALKELGVLLGRQQFLEAAREARRRFPSRGSLLSAAEAIDRADARRAIFAVLRDLSMRDGLVAEEAELLERLSAVWQIDWKSDSIEM